MTPAQLREIANALASLGRNGDTILAHINPQEAAILKALGGSGAPHPLTGLPQFAWWDDDSSSSSTWTNPDTGKAFDPRDYEPYDPGGSSRDNRSSGGSPFGGSTPTPGRKPSSNDYGLSKDQLDAINRALDEAFANNPDIFGSEHSYRSDADDRSGGLFAGFTGGTVPTPGRKPTPPQADIDQSWVDSIVGQVNDLAQSGQLGTGDYNPLEDPITGLLGDEFGPIGTSDRSNTYANNPRFEPDGWVTIGGFNYGSVPRFDAEFGIEDRVNAWGFSPSRALGDVAAGLVGPLGTAANLAAYGLDLYPDDWRVLGNLDLGGFSGGTTSLGSPDRDDDDFINALVQRINEQSPGDGDDPTNTPPGGDGGTGPQVDPTVPVVNWAWIRTALPDLYQTLRNSPGVNFLATVRDRDTGELRQVAIPQPFHLSLTGWGRGVMT